LLPLLAALAAAPPPAVDLTKIDRSLAHEPAYGTRLPKYCLLAFGPEAATRVWLAIDGNELFVDRNGNRDLTEDGERVPGTRSGKWLDFHAGTLTTADGKARDLHLRIREFDPALGTCTGMTLILDGQRKHFVGHDEANPFRFAQRPGQAPIVHLEGPLQLRLYGDPVTLVVGEEAQLNVSIGTPGVGPGSFCAIQCCTVLDRQVSPVADIEFPRRNPAAATPRLRVPIADD
jgi:hypothetical protein